MDCETYRLSCQLQEIAAAIGEPLWTDNASVWVAGVAAFGTLVLAGMNWYLLWRQTQFAQSQNKIAAAQAGLAEQQLAIATRQIEIVEEQHRRAEERENAEARSRRKELELVVLPRILEELEQQYRGNKAPYAADEFNRRTREDMRLAAKTGEASAEKLLSTLRTIETHSGVEPDNHLSLQEATDFLFPLLRGWVEDPASVDFELPPKVAERVSEARKKSHLKPVRGMRSESED